MNSLTITTAPDRVSARWQLIIRPGSVLVGLHSYRGRTLAHITMCRVEIDPIHTLRQILGEHFTQPQPQLPAP